MTDADADSGDDGKPDWWAKNQQLREALGLPAYEPSRLKDGAYTHEVVTRLETTYDCSIRLRAKNPQHPSNWSVVVDGDPLVSMDRRRTKRGNTVFQLTSAEFEDAVRASMTCTASGSAPTGEEGSN